MSSIQLARPRRHIPPGVQMIIPTEPFGWNLTSLDITTAKIAPFTEKASHEVPKKAIQTVAYHY